jgi:hypothetical protein
MAHSHPHNLGGYSFAEVATEVLDMQYPKLFHCLNDISDKMQDHCDHIDWQLLKTITEQLNNVLDDLYRKEKLVFSKLLPPQAMPDTETPEPLNLNLDWIKKYHKDIISAIYRAKFCIGSMILENQHEAAYLKDVDQLIQKFESVFIMLKIKVEEQLMAAIESTPFKKPLP